MNQNEILREKLKNKDNEVVMDSKGNLKDFGKNYESIAKEREKQIEKLIKENEKFHIYLQCQLSEIEDWKNKFLLEEFKSQKAEQNLKYNYYNCYKLRF